MKKYLKTTLGRKLLAFYLVLFAITFYLITTVGRDYISERVESESISNLRSVGITLLGSHINEQRYTKTTILSLRDQLKMASEAAEAEILIVCSDGDVILNTDTEKTYNIYQGSSSFLHEDVIKDTKRSLVREFNLCHSANGTECLLKRLPCSRTAEPVYQQSCHILHQYINNLFLSDYGNCRFCVPAHLRFQCTPFAQTA